MASCFHPLNGLRENFGVNVAYVGFIWPAGDEAFLVSRFCRLLNCARVAQERVLVCVCVCVRVFVA